MKDTALQDRAKNRHHAQEGVLALVLPAHEPLPTTKPGWAERVPVSVNHARS